MKDGGPAFPRSPHSGDASDDGMTLRDYFAAKAMASMMTPDFLHQVAQSIGCSRDSVRHEIARLAYAQADAMLIERGK